MKARVVTTFDVRPEATRARNAMNRAHGRARPWLYVVRDAWRDGRRAYDLLRVSAQTSLRRGCMSG